MKIKNLYNALANDILGEGFTRTECILYGIVAPLALVAACLLASIL